MAKVKYPLTPEAKEAAKSLVKAWDNQQVEQTFYLVDHVTVTEMNVRHIKYTSGAGCERTFEPPLPGIWHELAEYHLLRLDRVASQRAERFEVTLLQELRSAVASDFDVSDFFLTTQAVGTIINVSEGSSVNIPALQSGASVYGDVDQTQINTPAELTEKLLQILDPVMLEENSDLAEAIRGLAMVEEPKRKLQFGKVISQLGNSLQHTANTVVIIQALGILFQFLYSNKIL